MLGIISLFLNLLRTVLCFIPEDVPCGLEWNLCVFFFDVVSYRHQLNPTFWMFHLGSLLPKDVH